MAFNGFTRETFVFLQNLALNNNKPWFGAHRQAYEKHVLTPLRTLVADLSELMLTIDPDFEVRPAVNKTISRIYRDTRFSKDKSPFKTYLGVFFWEGPGKKMENPGFYFHLEPSSLLLGTGIHVFPRPVLQAYQDAVVDPELGPAPSKSVGRSAGPFVPGSPLPAEVH